MLTDALLVLGGVALLYAGGELLVRNASELARSWGLSPLVIGLTIVAFGTSAPELAASLTASLRGSPEIALGNVVGSNSANIGLILGITALLQPLRAQAAFLRREIPIMVGAAVLLVPMMLGGTIGRAEGAVLVLLLVAFLWVLFRGDEAPQVEEEFRKEYAGRAAATAPWAALFGAAAGLASLVAGAQALVAGATSLARGFGVPELIIGLTLVAVGTSLPELATSVIAALKGEPDIALGNVVGSNVFNVLGILGVTAMVRPIAVPFASVGLDLGAMIGFSVLLVPLLITGQRLGRREGGFLLALYVSYVAYLYVR